MNIWGILVLGFLGCAQAPPPHVPVAATPPATSGSREPASVSPPSPPVLRAAAAPSSGEQGVSSLVVVNRYLVQEYLFIDQEPKGVLPVGGEGRFEVRPGPHTLMVSDSPDGGRNQQFISEVYEPQTLYRYEIVSR